MTNVQEIDGISESAQTIDADATFSRILESRDAKTINGIVDKPSSYDIDLVWLDNKGNEITTESVASSVSGQTEFSENWHSVKQCRLEITDNSSTQEDAGISVIVT